LRRDVERVANISYGDGGMRNRLNFVPLALSAPECPCICALSRRHAHEGQEKPRGAPSAHQLASHGWVCTSANYRLRPRAQFPEHLIDVKKVIACVREHGPEYGAGLKTLILSGTSSGGQLAALGALTAGDRNLQPGFERAGTSVSAVVYLSGFYGCPGTRRQEPWSPLARDASEAPPFLVLHGDKDSVVAVQQARLFVAHLRRTSPKPVIYA
jgi:acetyl esterase/lipase